MGGKSDSPDEVTQKTEPWAPLQPFLVGGQGRAGVLPQADLLYRQGPSMTTGFTPLQLAGQQQQLNYAQQLNPNLALPDQPLAGAMTPGGQQMPAMGGQGGSGVARGGSGGGGGGGLGGIPGDVQSRYRTLINEFAPGRGDNREGQARARPEVERLRGQYPGLYAIDQEIGLPVPQQFQGQAQAQLAPFPTALGGGATGGTPKVVGGGGGTPNRRGSPVQTGEFMPAGDGNAEGGGLLGEYQGAAEFGLAGGVGDDRLRTGIEGLLSGGLQGGPLGEAMEFGLTDAIDVESNPYFQRAAEAAMRPLQRNLEENVLPSIGRNFTDAGQYGSSRQGIAEGIAARGTQEAISDRLAQMGSQAYGQGLQAQQNALQMGLGQQRAGTDMALGQQARTMAFMPNVLQSGMLPGEILSSIGAQQRELQQQAQMEPYRRLEMYRNALAGTPSGQQSSQPVFGGGGGVLSGLGGAATGFGLADMMGVAGGPWGTGLAALGGLAGLFG